MLAQVIVQKSVRIVFKALGQKRFFSHRCLNLNFDKFTAQLHLPQGGRKTGAMQLRFFFYDLPFRHLSYTKCRNVTIMTTQNILEGDLPHTV